jgi:hypothetical protein
MKYRACGILIALLFAASCGASGRTDDGPKVPGLTADSVARLNGVWEDVRVRSAEATLEEQKIPETFTWGKGRIVVNGSTFFDFGASPPLMALADMADFTPLRVNKHTSQTIEFDATMVGADGPINKATILIRFYEAGEIGVSANINGFWGSEFRYYRTYSATTP